MKNIFKRAAKIILISATFPFFFICSLYALTVIYYPEEIFYFYRGEDETSIFVEIDPLGIRRKISKTDTYKAGDPGWSPDMKHLAYFDMTREKIYDKEWTLKIINARTFKEKTVFIGTDKTSYYEWIDDNTARVYMSVGTGARIYRDIDINNNNPFVAIDHMSSEYWKSEKTF